MHNVSVAFDKLEDATSAPESWNTVTVHLVFDVRMYLTSKSMQVIDGNRTRDPILYTLTYM